jgi:low affinity Fe/Cu permease
MAAAFITAVAKVWCIDAHSTLLHFIWSFYKKPGSKTCYPIINLVILMNPSEAKRHATRLERFSHGFAGWAGSASGFLIAAISMAVWVVIGWACRFSQGWENGLTIYIEVITFLMIFLMQRAQNKGLAAINVKLSELIAATDEADNKLINVEDLSEKEIHEVRETHRDLSQRS